MQQLIIHFFSKVLERDEDTLNLISSFHGEVGFIENNTVLVFSLNGLYKLLCEDKVPSYSKFRKIIYNSTVNEVLQKLGAKLDIHQSSGDVDGSLYKLIKY